MIFIILIVYGVMALGIGKLLFPILKESNLPDLDKLSVRILFATIAGIFWPITFLFLLYLWFR